MPMKQCFLCEKRDNAGTQLQLINESRVSTSQKPVSKVLQHLANGLRTKLVFQYSASICTECLNKLSEYDNLMIDLLRFQKNLVRQLDSVLNKDIRKDAGHEDTVAMETHEEFKFETSTASVKDEIIVDVSDDFDTIVEDDQQEGDNITDADTDDDEDSMTKSPNRRRRRYDCLSCSMVFTTNAHFKEHMNTAHNKVYSCHLCGAVKRDEEYLELHMNLHEGKTENECRYCSKSFSRPVNTLRHMRKHWDKKKYQCEKCGERFSQDNLLYNHRLRHDAEENPVICSVCQQSFKSKKTYNHHMLIHQENRPRHHCKFCVKSFTERYTLKMHMKTHYLDSIPVQHEIVYRDNTQFDALEGKDDSQFDALEGKDNSQFDALEVKDNSQFDALEGKDNSADDSSCLVCSTKFEDRITLRVHLKNEHNVS